MIVKNLLLFIVVSINTTTFCSTYRLTSPGNTLGLFSSFNVVVGALDDFEKNRAAYTGFIVDYAYHHCYGHNWWEQYFEPIRLGVCDDEEKKVPMYKKIAFSLTAQFKISRERGNELIKKYIKVKPHIQSKIDLFGKEHFEGNYVIGIHYRGTDKVGEAPAVLYQELFFYITQEIDESINKNIKIFIATDECAFLEFMKMNFPGKVVALDAIRSHNDIPLHHSDIDGYKKGEDAVIDCILLSKCSKLYKMASNLSDTSLKFNPFLPVVHLNKAHYEKINAPSEFYIVYNAIIGLLNKLESNTFTDFIMELSPEILKNLNGSNNLLTIKSNLPYYDMEILGFENMFEIDPYRAHYLLEKYIPLKPHITTKIDEIVKHYFNNSYIIGIYYVRYPHEPSVPYEELERHLNKAINNAPKNFKVLLITNDVSLYRTLQSQVPVIGNPIEPKESDYDLLTTALLSRSNIVLGVGSFCIKLVPQLNPTIPVIELNKLWLESYE